MEAIRYVLLYERCDPPDARTTRWLGTVIYHNITEAKQAAEKIAKESIAQQTLLTVCELHKTKWAAVL